MRNKKSYNNEGIGNEILERCSSITENYLAD